MTLVDHTHQADPESARAALAQFTEVFPRQRRVLLLGRMRDLGPEQANAHADLLDPVLQAEPAAVYLVGWPMTNLWSRLPAELRGAHLNSIDQLRAVVELDARDDDAMLLLASPGAGLRQLGRDLRAASTRATQDESWHVLISGDRVHAVGFRRWLRKRAVQYGLTGWVRNRKDRALEAVLTGPGPAVDEVLARAHAGPRRAQVQKMVTTRRQTTDGPSDFEIRADRQV